MITESQLGIIFIIGIFGLLALDLGRFQKNPHKAGLKEAIYLTIFYVIISLLFALLIYVELGSDKAGLFLTGYIVEKSLSVDNLFVFLIIFSYFGVSIKYQHRILFWGILGALITRGIFIAGGVTLISKFHFLLYGLGLFLVYTGIKILRSGDDDQVDPSKNILLKYYNKYFSKYYPLKQDYVGANFFIKENSIRYITPLFIVLLVIESTDVMFATDSVPAVLSITQDPFIVYTSNIFAILGLRALYFVIANAMPSFPYLKYGVAVVLSFIGIKMLVASFIVISTGLSLGIVVSCLTLSIIASLMWKEEEIKG